MKTQNPFIGRSRGSLANVVASTYLGHNILKSKPLEVRNPKTAKQQNVRFIMGSAGTLAKIMSSFSPIAKRSARTGRNTNKTARTALVSAILQAKSGVSPNISLSQAGISLSGSGIAVTIPTSAIFDPALNKLTVTWPAVLPYGGSQDDNSMIVVANLDTLDARQTQGAGPRSLGSATITLQSGFASSGDRLAVFLMFDSADGLLYDSTISVAATE